ncbi:RagB/SusD family nutrient uptake outer membrane protein [Dysgonomonas termitidis]|uniref:RagB/SusD family nutrient uptake outer membrane protein n=1 Tax=Dysgonomonas termitidis TaxID=1516126 RepID=A0ABV9KV95_9BACT
MKKIYIFLLSVISLAGLNSCDDYLSIDKYVNDMLTIDTVFSKKHYTEQWLWNTYSTLNGKGAEIANKGTTAFAFASDESIFGDWDGGKRCQKYQNCEYTASDQLSEDRWSHLYQGIRKASIFIHNVDKCGELSNSEREDLRAQARFLRAYFYWMLIKQYGPVPIMPDEPQDISLEYQDLAVARNTYDECIDFINQELIQSARVLPPTRNASRLGQATRGAALATRAKVLLYAASPLYNGNMDLSSLTDDAGRQLISQTYSEEKWAKAAAAAKEVIDLGVYELLTVKAGEETVPVPSTVSTANTPYPNGSGGIDPYKSYMQCFNGEVTASKNPEFIFTRQSYTSDDLNDISKHAAPRQMIGWNTIATTLKQEKAYLMCDGKPITHSSPDYPYQTQGFTLSLSEYPYIGNNVSLRYANREPRLYASISFNGSIWENGSTTETQKIGLQYFYYKDDPSGKRLSEPDFYLRTGIGVKKYYHPEDSWNIGGQVKYKVEPAIRYADVLLWYAESLNELTSGQVYEIPSYSEQGNISVKRETGSIESRQGMRYGFSRVRFRAGLPDLSDADYSSYEQFKKELKRERQVELFLESARYFDLRRWKDAAVEENLPVMGLNVDMNNSDAQKQRFYDERPSDMPKVFLEKMYLWPIPKSELTRNKKLTQNPGWK